MSEMTTPPNSTEPADHSRPHTVSTSVFGRIKNIALSRGVLALIDQAIVSGLSFATGILVKRALAGDAGDTATGQYALGVTIVILITSIWDSLVSAPYTVLCHRLSGEDDRRYAGSTLAHTALLMILAVPALLIAGLVAGSSAKWEALTPAIWVLSGAVPFWLLREFARRYSFAHLQLGEAVVLDATVATFQLLALLGLYLGGWLNAASALGTIGVSCGLAALAWLLLHRRRFAVHAAHVGTDGMRNGKFGLWILGEQVIGWLHEYASVWLLALYLTTAATGLYAQYLWIVQLSNPLLLGLGNIFAPSLAQAFARGGTKQLSHAVHRAALLLGGAMVVFTAVLAVAGEPLLALFYQRDDSGHQLILVVLAVAAFFKGIGMAYNAGLRAAEQTAATFRASANGMIVMFACTGLLLGPLHLLGAALGLLAGNMASTLWRIVAYYQTVAALERPKQSDVEPLYVAPCPSKHVLWRKSLPAIGSPMTPGNPSVWIGTFLFVAAAILTEANFRITTGETVSLDWQVLMRLALLASMGVYGLYHLGRTWQHLLEFPGAWTLLLTLWALLTIPFAINPLHATVATTAILCLTVFAPAAIDQIGQQRTAIAFTIGLLGFIAACWATFYLYPELGRYPFNPPEETFGRDRLAGLSPPNGLGRQAGLTLIFVMVLGYQQIWRWRTVLLASAFLLVTAYMTDSKTAMISIVVSMSYLGLRILGSRRVTAIACCAAAAIGLLFWLNENHLLPINLDAIASRFSRSGDADEVYSLTGRDALWEFTIRKISESPICGYGMGCVRFVMPESDIAWGTFQAHNLFLNLALMTGIVGAGFFAASVLSQLFNSFRQPSLLVDTLLIHVLIGGIGDSMMFNPITDCHTLVWFMMLYWRAAPHPAPVPARLVIAGGVA